ncbi:MAG: FHA domain-containing protein, partial [Candidatus Sumerlaeota bacterium]
MSSLLVVKGPNVGLRYELQDHTTIGRLPDNSIQVLDPNVSRYHCEISKHKERYEIRDKDSANGVIVNGERVKEAALQSNDEIAIGAAVFLFDTDDELKHTRFSNKRILLSSTNDETFPEFSAPRHIGIERSGPAAFERALLLELGDLFSSSRLPLGEALERILGIIHRLFNARLSCLLKYDPVLEEFIPLVAISDEDDVTVSKFVIQTVLREKQAILLPLTGVAATVRTLTMRQGDTPVGPRAPGTYRVGPLARVNVAERMGTPLADAALADFRGEFGRVPHGS